MVIMALDHVRDFFPAGAMVGSPTNLNQTTPILFFTRWITHFCLPVFMFTAGMGIFFVGRRSESKGQLSRYLVQRGIWLIVLELTAMQLLYNFNFSFSSIVLLLVLWIFGICMLTMAALIHLPVRWLAFISVVAIVFHNCLDGINAAQFGSGAWVCNLIHQPGVLSVAGHPVLVTYTLVPWVAVMAAGFCFGRVFLLERPVRRRLMLRLGSALTVAFVVIRALNIYGDPAPWTVQKSGLFAALSFLNCTKYPGSLDFLLMTLGPSLLLLACLDGWAFKITNPLIVFGRVPLFYFILHFFAIHTAVALMAWLRYGSSAHAFIFNPVPSMGGPRQLYPPDFGYSLWVVYGVWVAIVVALYPLCRWFAKVKAVQRVWWLNYL
jgi:uncharacterized membrane protein